MTTVWILAGVLIYSILHARLIGNSTVLAAFSIVMAVLFLCQTPAYTNYYGILSNCRWIVMAIVTAQSIALAMYSRKPMPLQRWWLFPLMLAPYFLLSSEWSINPELTIQRAISLMLMWSVVFGIVWYVLPSPHLFVGVLKAMVLPVAYLYLALIPAYGFNISYVDQGYLRSSGSMLNPNASGTLGALLLPISYYLWRTALNGRKVWLLAMCTLGFMILTSGARGALTATIFAVTFLIFKEMRSKGAFWLVAVLTATVGGVVIEFISLPEIVAKYLRVENLEMLGGRWEAWQASWAAITERPFLGYGFGNEDLVFDYISVFFLHHAGAMVHNSYLGLALQVGFFGAMLFFLPLITIGFAGIREGTTSGERRISVLAAVVIAALMIALTESWIYSAGNAQALPFWVAFGLLAGLLREKRRQRKIKHMAELGGKKLNIRYYHHRHYPFRKS